MSAPLCVRCERPVADQAFACKSCAEHVEKLLASTPAFARELETTVARLDRIQRRGVMPDTSTGAGPVVGPICAGYRREHHCDHPSCAEIWPLTVALRPTALPVDLDAVKHLDAATNVLTTWCRHVAETRGSEVPRVHKRLRETSAGVAAAWLTERGNLEWLRHREEVGEAFEQLERAAMTIERVVDRLPELWYAGPCEACGAEVYAQPSATIVRCDCGDTWPAAGRREWLLAAAEDYLLTIPEILGALPNLLGFELRRQTVHSWVRRSRLKPHGLTANGRETYRVGDVLDLAATLKRTA